MHTRLLVVQSDPDKSLGRLEVPLIDAGADVDMRLSDRELPDVAGYDGLVVLPGLANPVDDTVEVRRTRDAIRAALDRRMPVLGVCLGGELLIEELGGRSYRCRPELGFRQVLTAAAAGEDPLLSAAPERFSVFHAHTFAFEPPSGAEILLTNDVCVQACRYGNTWAVQCHPEVSREWVSMLAARIEGRDSDLLPATASFFRENGIKPEELERDADAAEPAIALVAAQIGGGFALAVAEASTAPCGESGR